VAAISNTVETLRTDLSLVRNDIAAGLVVITRILRDHFDTRESCLLVL
jgi:hypothetical protein